MTKASCGRVIRRGSSAAFGTTAPHVPWCTRFGTRATCQYSALVPRSASRDSAHLGNLEELDRREGDGRGAARLSCQQRHLPQNVLLPALSQEPRGGVTWCHVVSRGKECHVRQRGVRDELACSGCRQRVLRRLRLRVWQAKSWLDNAGTPG
eukprot:3141714-Rhodomonas_salina.2